MAEEQEFLDAWAFPLFRVSAIEVPTDRRSPSGIVVNEGVRVPRELRRELRAILFNCEKNGIEVAV